MSRIASPFNVGDTIKIKSRGSGYPKGTTTKVLAIGYDEDHGIRGRSAWRVKVDLDKGRNWWSAGWFTKVK